MRFKLSTAVPFVVLASIGCGTDLGDALIPVAQSTARGAADIVLSQLALALDEMLNPPPPPEPGPPEGDPVLGQVIFEANNCLFCHCEDARGGCASGALNIQGASYALVDSKLRGPVSHTGGKFPEFTDFDIADLAAYLGQLALGQQPASP